MSVRIYQQLLTSIYPFEIKKSFKDLQEFFQYLNLHPIPSKVMNMQMPSEPIPDDLINELNHLFRTINPNATAEPIDEFILISFYLRRKTLNSNDGVKEHLAQLGLRQEEMMLEFLEYFTRLNRIENRFHVAFKRYKINKKEISAQVLANTMFEVFQNWPEMDDDNFCQTLKRQFTLKILSKPNLLKAILEAKDCTDDEKFYPIGQKVASAEIEQFNNRPQSSKKSIVSVLHKRIIAYNECAQSLSKLGLSKDQIKEVIDFIFEYRSNSGPQSQTAYQEEQQINQSAPLLMVDHEARQNQQLKFKSQIKSVEEQPIFKKNKLNMIHPDVQISVEDLIKKYHQEIKDCKDEIIHIEKKTQAEFCLNKSLRQLRIAVMMINERSVRQLVEKIKKHVILYELDHSYIQRLENLTLTSTEIDKRIENAKTIMYDIEILNLPEIQLGMIEVDRQEREREQIQYGIVLFGDTGTGKSTVYTGLAGHKLKEIQVIVGKQTEYYYQVQDEELAEKFRISARLKSCTKFPSFTLVNEDWNSSNKKPLFIIDTGGFEDTRGEQIDIINNIATKKIISKVKNGIFAIVISSDVLVKRGALFRDLAKKLEKYINSLSDMQSQIVFLFTKGLTTEKMLNIVEEVIKEDGQKKSNFCNMFKNKLKQLVKKDQQYRHWEIKNPSTHSFEQLTGYLCKAECLQDPYESINTSYSVKSCAKMKEKRFLLEKLIKKAYELKESKITLFYLHQLNQIEKNIQKAGTSAYKTCIKFIQDKENQKLSTFQGYLNRFLERNIPQYLKEIQGIENALLETQQLCKYIFESENIPIVILQSQMKKEIKEAVKAFEVDDFQKSPTTMRAYLRLLQKYQPLKHEQIILKQQEKKISIQRKLQQLINSDKIEKKEWEKQVDTYIGLFLVKSELDKEQRYKKITQIIKKGLQKLNYTEDINDLLKNGRKKLFQRSLKQIIDKYQQKLDILIDTHYTTREEINILKQNCTLSLENECAYYMEYLEKIQDLTQDEVKNLKTTIENSKQVFSVLEKYNKGSHINTHRKKTSMNEMVEFMKSNFEIKTLEFSNLILKSLNNPQITIDTQQVKRKFKTFSKLLTVLRQMQNQSQEQFSQQNENSQQIPGLHQILQEAQQTIQNIINLRKFCSIQQDVIGFEINYQLLGSYVIISAIELQFKEEKHRQECQQIIKNLVDKMRKPLKQMTQCKFEEFYDFEMVKKLMKYLKALDSKCKEYQTRSNYFQPFINYITQKQVSIVLKNFFDKINRMHQQFEDFNYQDEWDDQHPQNLGENDNLNSKYVKDAIQYIRCYDIAKDICQEFGNKGINKINAQLSDFSKKNLQKKISDKLKLFEESIEEHQNLLTQEGMRKLARKVNRLLRILEQSNKIESKKRFIPLKQRIFEIIKKLGQDWKVLFTSIQQSYKDIRVGEDFNPLQIIISHVGSRVEENQIKLMDLLDDIDRQIVRQLENLFIDFSQYDDTQKINAFQSIYIFKDIWEKFWKDNKYVAGKKHKFEIDMLKNNCKALFKAFEINFYQTIQKLQEGKIITDNELSLMQSRQRRIQVYLRQQYQQFLNKREGKGKSLFAELEQKRAKFRKTVEEKYLGENFQLDENYYNIYQNASPQLKIKLENNYSKYIEKLMNKCQKSLNENHQEFEEKAKAIENCYKISLQQKKPHFHELEKMKQQKQKLEQKYKENCKIQVRDKNSSSIFKILNEASKINNQKVIQYAKQSFQQYCIAEVNSIDFVDYKRFDDLLTRNSQISKCPEFCKKTTHNSEVAKMYEGLIQNFQRQIKKTIQSIKNVLEVEKARVKDKFNQNPLLIFKIDQQKDYEFKSISILKNIIVACSNHTKFQGEVIQAYNVFDEIIDESQKDLTSGIQFLKQLLEKVERNESVKSEQTQIKIASKLKLACYSQQQNKSLIEFNQLTKVIKSVNESKINQFEEILARIKQEIKLKYNDSKKLSLRATFSNDTDDRIKKRIRKIETQITSIDFFAKYFVKEEQIPKNVLQTIQMMFDNQFKSWEADIQRIINETFKNKSDNYREIEMVPNFYKASKMFEKQQFRIFSETTHFDEKDIPSLLTNLYKQNVSQLKEFYNNEENIEFFMDLGKKIIEQKNELDRQKKQLIKKESTQIDEFITEKDKQTKAKINKLALTEQNNDENKNQILRIAQSDKEAKKNDIRVKHEQEKNNFELRCIKKQAEINQQIEKFVQESFCRPLIINRTAKINFQCQHYISHCGNDIQSHLKQVEKKFGKKIIKIIYKILKNDDHNFAKFIISEQKVFEHIKNLKFQELTSGIDFNTLITKVPKLSQDINKLNKMIKLYNKYEELYDEILEDYKQTSDFKQQQRSIIRSCKNLGQVLKSSYNNQRSSAKGHELIAHIFALWSIMKCTVDEENNVDYVYKPHAGQILAIFLLLDLDGVKNQSLVQRVMVQVCTGEGKSVILAAISAYLALSGFKVYEACYSKYLSQRDYESFKDLFVALDIHEDIHYDIFPEICKKILNQDPNEPFIKKLQKYLLNKDQWSNNRISGWLSNIVTGSLMNNSSEKRVLLIDEADVFVNEQFLGQSYYPAIQIRKQCIRELLDFVWSLKDQAHTLEPQVIIKSEQFKTVCDQLEHPDFTKILKNQVNQMIRGLINFKNDEQSRCIQNGKIYYRQGDGLSDKVHYGYKTIFAYYHHYYVKNQIDINEFNKQVFLNLIVASFSYSRLPHMFDSILGVTGTLEAMSQSQLEILKKEYQVEKQYILPSIYSECGHRKIQFKKVYSLELFKSIAQNAAQEFQKKRPVIIFFQTKKSLYDFFDSEDFQKLKFNASIVTYEVNPTERDFRIQTSTFDTKITLMTTDFGRGTDFKLISDKKDDAGLHIISSYLPKSYCDYVQLVGRVGRQGRNGSVCIHIVEQNQVEERNQNVPVKQAQDQIRARDNEEWSQKMKNITKRMQESIKEHNQTKDIYGGTLYINRILENIYKINQCPELLRKKSRTIIMLDATRSMNQTFAMITDVLKKSIPRIHQIQKSQSALISCQLQLCVYRNYNSGEDGILQHSDFELKSEPLIQWISGIKIDGGWQNEAIEVALQYVNSLEEVDQIIIIGDAAGNTKQDTDLKRTYKSFKQTWDVSTQYPITYLDDEIEKIKAKGIQIHSFYLNPFSTKQFFQDLSNQTNGKHQEFKIQSKQAAEQFTNFISKRILENLGQKAGCADLVDAYKRSYCQ